MTDAPTTPVAPAIDVNLRIEQMVRLRDLKKQIEDKHKEELAPIKETIEMLETVLKSQMDALNVDSLSGPAGNVHKVHRKSCSVADMDSFWTHVVTQAAWDMLDKKANVSAVADYVAKNGTPPPGVNFNTIVTVGVTRK